MLDSYSAFSAPTFSVCLHPAGGVDGVSKQAVAGHLQPHHRGTAGRLEADRCVPRPLRPGRHPSTHAPTMLFILFANNEVNDDPLLTKYGLAVFEHLCGVGAHRYPFGVLENLNPIRIQ